MKILTVDHACSREERFKFLLVNKQALIMQKKLQCKTSDGFVFDATTLGKLLAKRKAAGMDANTLQVLAVINTTNVIDSCLDGHMPGLWVKSLNENKQIKHLQEHDMAFDKIIADGKDLKVYTEKMLWRDLGVPQYKGVTEALIFDSMVKQSRNAFMYDQYKAGYVDNHSVYMRYVNMVLCIDEADDPEYGAEKEAWDKYLPFMVNPEKANEFGYFWAITEAKIIEGSAVPIGANSITPTLSVTTPGPSTDTPKRLKQFNISVPEKKGFKLGGKTLSI